MPIMRLKEMREMPSDERAKRLRELRTELTRLKTMVGAGGTVENPARIKELRKTVAQMLTIGTEEKLGLVKVKPKEKKPKERKRKKKEETQK